ncbi:MAG: dTDP-glucose 4,6-dehydratase [Planctomycetes bacterium]|nr:dTDP-glucose 4,6-dehydratase [Planctomycetota bacterium]
MRRILITGGAGFIGSNLVRLLLGERPDREIWNLDSLTYAGSTENLADIGEDPRHHFLQGDVRDAKAVADALELSDAQAVIHLAAETHVDRSISDPLRFLQTNAVGTGILLEEVRRRGGIRFVQVSTDEVYGDLGFEGAPFREEDPVRPSNPYSAAKAAGDHLALAWHRTFDVEALVTRCSNNYGPRQHPEKLIPMTILRALDGLSIPLYRDGRNVRDWIHVDDHARGILAALEQGMAGAVYNLGGGTQLPNLDIARRILRELGRDESLIRFVPDRLGHDLRYAMDTSRAERELRWRPRIDIEAGLTETVAWYRAHRSWCDRILGPRE